MCGRFTLHTPESRIREAFGLEHTEPLGLEARYNIAPSQEIPIIRESGTGREMVMARWGLVPHWSKEPKTRYSTINARIESVAEKPAYRVPFRRSRCLVPADGFYEWKVIGKNKVPHYITLNGGELFAFAGIWDHWEGEGTSLDSCSIIVMPASEKMQQVHERMPAIIAPAFYDHWIDSRVTEQQEIHGLLKSAATNFIQFHPVSTWVNSPRNTDARCIKPAG